MIQSHDDLTRSLVDGQEYRTDWNKITGGVAYTAGRWYDLSTLNGHPVANTFAGTALNATIPNPDNFIYNGGNVTPDVKHLLHIGGVSIAATSALSTLQLVDICMYYPGINMNVNTLQTLINTNVLTRYTDGKGLRAYLVVNTSTGATAHNLSMSYTNSDNIGSRTLPFTVSCTASAITPHITHSGVAANNYGPFLPMASGDKGIRSVQSVQLSAASGSGTATLVIAKPIASIPLPVAGAYSERDLMSQLPSLPRIQDGACLSWLLLAGGNVAASTSFYGHIQTVWD